jgi:hypothetical protein
MKLLNSITYYTGRINPFLTSKISYGWRFTLLRDFIRSHGRSTAFCDPIFTNFANVYHYVQYIITNLTQNGPSMFRVRIEVYLNLHVI